MEAQAVQVRFTNAQRLAQDATILIDAANALERAVYHVGSTERSDLLVHRMEKAAAEYRRKADRIVYLAAHTWDVVG